MNWGCCVYAMPGFASVLVHTLLSGLALRELMYVNQGYVFTVGDWIILTSVAAGLDLVWGLSSLCASGKRCRDRDVKVDPEHDLPLVRWMLYHAAWSTMVWALLMGHFYYWSDSERQNFNALRYRSTPVTAVIDYRQFLQFMLIMLMMVVKLPASINHTYSAVSRMRFPWVRSDRLSEENSRRLLMKERGRRY